MKALGVVLALAVVALGAVIVLPLMALSSLTGGSSLNLGPPQNLGAVSPPASIVALDEQVSSAPSSLVPCSVPASLLLAQQDIESGYRATVVSSAAAVGLSQFEPGTFAEYDEPVPPGGATPPTPDDPVDSAYAEARYLCSLGVDKDPTGALVAYNCGDTSAACVAASSGYADEILSLASRISGPVIVSAVPPAR